MVARRISAKQEGSQKKEKSDDTFKLRQVFTSFASFPRVFKLVWLASAPLTMGLASLTVVRGLIPVVSVTISQLVVDSVVRGIRLHSITPIWLPVILQLSISVLDRLLSNSSNTIQFLLQEKVSNHIQLQILRKANTLDLTFFEDAEFYDKLRQASSEANYKPVAMIQETCEIVRTFITLCSMFLLLLQLSWWLVIVALIVPIPSFLAGSRYGWRDYWRVRKESPERRQMSYYNTVMTVDNSHKEIKLFNLGDFFISRYITLMNKFYVENKKMLITRNASKFLWSVITVAANSAIYLYVALQAVLGRITLGALIKYTQASIQAGASVQTILDDMSDTYENTLFVSTVFEFLEYTPTILSPEQPEPLVRLPDLNGLPIEFRNVSFTYPGKLEAALKHVSFTIAAGEAVALVGRNGAGKTTLVKLLTRLYDPDEGEILIGGRNIREYDLDDLRAHIGVIFQDFVQYHMTASENIGLGRITEIDDIHNIQHSAEKSGADVVIGRLENGYETMLGRWFKQGVQLSGGEWQKIALARAFMRDAPILVLDEPTSALDPQSEYDVFTRFRQLTEGKTAIFISHRFSTVRLADRILVLEYGGVQECGSHAELMALNGRYAELFNLQAEAYR
jgi:ATP-binding cassette, subfamily B, bacterial